MLEAIFLISNSDFSLDITKPLPKMSISVHRIDRLAMPRIKFSPACVFNKAILKIIFSFLNRYIYNKIH